MLGSTVDGKTLSVGRLGWCLFAPALLLNLVAAYLFEKFLGAAAFYSAWGPIASTTPADKVGELAYADYRAHVFFVSSVLVVTLAAMLMSPVIRLNRIGSIGFRAVSRYLLALILCTATTGMLVLVLGVLRMG